jgi:salicylate hydroxylase
MQQVLIAGGGIGGLTLALALSKHGIASRVFEARATPPREGAGIQLGPNATRLLRRLRLDSALRACAVVPNCIVVNDGQSGRELTRLPLGSWIADRHGAPYWVVHRADLYDILWQEASTTALIEIETGRTIESVDDTTSADLVTVMFAEGGTASGDVLVGADGLWSRTRQHINPDATLKFAGAAAARAVVSRAELPTRFAELATGVWLAPSAHVVHYPISGGDEVAIIAIGACEAPLDGWDGAVDNEVVARRFDKMPRELRTFLESVAEWRQWVLYRAEHAATWSKRRTVLIGDAAHPILPFLAQGGAMAIEDGFELAGVLAETGVGNPSSAIEAFSRRRQKRVVKVQAASIQNGQTYHLDGLAALVRNAALKTLPGSTFMRRYDWIYGYES